MKTIKELIDLTNKVSTIIEKEIPWKMKYDLVFSESISGRISKIIKLDYYDPDTSYKEDLLAYYSALYQEVEKLEKTIPRC